jgi:hypothetical protein
MNDDTNASDDLSGWLFPFCDDSDVILMPLQLESSKSICLGSSTLHITVSIFLGEKLKLKTKLS